jgi:molybdate transport system ATP-binding protein
VFVPPEARRVGVVFQDYLLFPHLDAAGNVAFGLRSRGLDRSQALEAAGNWLAKVGLEGFDSRRPSDLSGGEAQRVALARALATEPEAVLLDEPLAALDVTSRNEIRHLLSEHLASYQGPKLLITHEPTDAFLLADRVYIIEGGSITQEGTADDIRIRPRTRYAADLAGANLVRGIASGGMVETGSQAVQVADHSAAGPVLLTIHPHAIGLHSERPAGSPRNSWATRIDRIERLGDRVRVRTGEPLALIAEVTGEAAEELHLRTGEEIWVAIKATEIGVDPDVA